MLQVCPNDLSSALTSDVQFFKGTYSSFLISKLLGGNAMATQIKRQIVESCPLIVPELCCSVFFLVSGDVITRRHTVEMSEQNRDQLAKTIYGRLFSYLVNTANDYLQGQDDVVGYV